MSNRYSRIFHHISAKDLKRNREDYGREENRRAKNKRRRENYI